MHDALSLEWRFCELLHKSIWKSDDEEKKRVIILNKLTDKTEIEQKIVAFLKERNMQGTPS